MSVMKLFLQIRTKKNASVRIVFYVFAERGVVFKDTDKCTYDVKSPHGH